jgi:predicted transcriptional regulator
MSWLSQSNRQPVGPFGPLEWRVLLALWNRADAVSVRDLQSDFPDTAYTTIMTTLDRLHRKGVLERRKEGRAFYYRPYLTRPAFESARAAEAVRVALSGDDATVGPLLSALVDVVTDRDRELLDDLEALVRSRRAEIETESKK